jgi:hypothetical protein
VFTIHLFIYKCAGVWISASNNHEKNPENTQRQHWHVLYLCGIFRRQILLEPNRYSIVGPWTVLLNPASTLWVPQPTKDNLHAGFTQKSAKRNCWELHYYYVIFLAQKKFSTVCSFYVSCTNFVILFLFCRSVYIINVYAQLLCKCTAAWHCPLCLIINELDVY